MQGDHPQKGKNNGNHARKQSTHDTLLTNPTDAKSLANDPRRTRCELTERQRITANDAIDVEQHAEEPGHKVYGRTAIENPPFATLPGLHEACQDIAASSVVLIEST